MSMRLGIIVPYRDRAEHLTDFIPHLSGFFRSDAHNAHIAVRMVISEQISGLPFNRGFVKNAGFEVLSQDVDYVCFHDVDLLPEVADYRPTNRPAMIISEGLNFTPDFIRQLLGGVVLMDKTQFVAANGFSNDYWGWGFEDVDLRERLLRTGFSIEHRVGRFTRLRHVDDGSFPDGRPTPDHLKNQARYVALWFDKAALGFVRKREIGDFWKRDGLSNVAHIGKVNSRRQIETRDDALLVEHVLVEPLHRPLQP
jgi:N-terminal domain of galactosyltransferase/N-terminal region of glycosyl transferase group 7